MPRRSHSNTTESGDRTQQRDNRSRVVMSAGVITPLNSQHSSASSASSETNQGGTRDARQRGTSEGQHNGVNPGYSVGWWTVEYCNERNTPSTQQESMHNHRGHSRTEQEPTLDQASNMSTGTRTTNSSSGYSPQVPYFTTELRTPRALRSAHPPQIHGFSTEVRTPRADYRGSSNAQRESGHMPIQDDRYYTTERRPVQSRRERRVASNGQQVDLGVESRGGYRVCISPKGTRRWVRRR